MPVNLNGIDIGAAAASGARKTSPTQSSAHGVQDAAQQPESDVSITSTASLLAHLQQSLAANSSVDQSRVDSISKALADGTYNVNSQKIAHGLIHVERALGQLKLSEI